MAHDSLAIQDRVMSTKFATAPKERKLDLPVAESNTAIKRTKLHPRAFLLGILLGFIGCCIAGYLTTEKNQYGELPRFGQLTSPDSLFYPTFCQMQAIVRSRAKRDEILVVIGGDSVMNGCGQKHAQLWSKDLQNRLGSNFRVVNLALRASSTFEGAYFVAESLANEYQKLIFVTDARPAFCRNTALSFYDYLYFDGLHKGQLPKDSAWHKDFAIRQAQSGIKDRAKWSELDIHKRLDALCFFDDLWTTIGYRRIFTVWSSLTAGHFCEPRHSFPDNEPDLVPIGQRYQHLKADLEIIQKTTEPFYNFQGGHLYRKSSAWKGFEDQIQNVPSDFRKHCLILLMRNSPYEVQRLTEREQFRDAAAYHDSLANWQAADFTTTIIGDSFSAEDYWDRCHLTPPGGAKLASIVEGLIKTKAKELGYIP